MMIMMVMMVKMMMLKKKIISYEWAMTTCINLNELHKELSEKKSSYQK